MISFFLPGIPRPTQTGSVIRPGGGKRAFPVYRNTEWASYCRLMAVNYMRAAKRNHLTGPVELCLTFYLPRPKKPKCPWPVTRPDLGNLEKKLSDAWNGILWVDDSQIVRMTLEKRYATACTPVGLKVYVEETDVP